MNNFLKISDQPSIGIASPKLIGNRLDADYYRITFVENEEVLRESNIPIEILGNMWIEANYGSLPDSVDYSEDGIYLIRGTDISGYGIAPENELIRVPASYYHKFKKAQVFPGYLLILVKGASIDREDSNAIVPTNFAGQAIINGSVFKVKLKPEFDNYYVAAFMFSRYFLLQKRRSVTNTGALYNDLETIRNYQIALPHPKIQAYIGDKVRLAEKCREESENIKRSAQVLLDEILNLPSIDQLPQLQTNWWVDPEYAYPERLDPNYYQPKFLRTEEILSPKSSKFSEVVVNAKYGASVPADYKEEGIPFIRGTDLSPNRIDLTDLHHLDSSLAPKVKSAKVKTGDVLLTRSGTVGVAAAINERLDNFAFGSFMIKLRFKESISPVYAAAFLNSPYGITQIERQKNGAVQQNINLEEIDRLMLPLLTIDQQQKISYLWAKWNLYLDYSQRLIYHALSDIEKLIGGEMEIEEILIGKKESLSWDDIGEEINGQLINYA